MAVRRLNLTVNQGADFDLPLTLRDNSSDLMDLTDYVFRGQVKSSYSDSSPVLSFVFTIRNQTTEQGKVDMSLTAASTSALSISKKTNYIYDLEFVNPAGKITRFLEGQLTLMPEVTK